MTLNNKSTTPSVTAPTTDRATVMRLVVDTYVACTRIETENATDKVASMVYDLRHYCAQEGVDFYDASLSGCAKYAAERKANDERAVDDKGATSGDLEGHQRRDSESR